MFGTIESYKTPIMVDIEGLIDNIVNNARFHALEAGYHRSEASEFAARGEDYSAAWHIGQAGYARGRAMWVTLPLRTQIEQRTRTETTEARRLVNDGTARFMEPACGDETCGDCDLPLWQHIRIVGEQTLCPFGRRYWQIARALLSAGYGIGPKVRHELLANIARRP